MKVVLTNSARVLTLISLWVAVGIDPHHAYAVESDSFGYVVIDSTQDSGPQFDFIDISGSGDPVLPALGDDNGVVVNIGFSFPFYGEEYSETGMASNGYLNFNVGGILSDLGNDCPLPAGNTPSNSIYVLWDDLDLGNTPDQGAYVQNFTDCPNTEGGVGECTVFQWTNVDHFPNLGDFDFQAILYESGNILMNFRGENLESGAGSTTGIEAPSNSDGLTYACNIAGSMPSDLSVLFVYPTFVENLTSESETNGTTANADLVSAGSCGFGSIAPIGDKDYWVAENAQAGDLVFAVVETNRSNTGVDSFLRLLEGDGTTLIAQDDASGFEPGLVSSSAIGGAIVPSDGDLFFEITDQGSDETITPYELHQIIVRPDDTASEIEPNDNALTATPISASYMTGESDNILEEDFYSFEGEAGDAVVVVVDDNPDRDGNNTDTFIEILDRDGVTPIALGDDGSALVSNATGRAVLPADGTYFVKIFADQSETNDSEYRFTVMRNCAAVCGDADGDGVCDGVDNCASDSNSGQENSDQDDSGDACDGCPLDSQKLEPGVCGCGVSDVDTDGDSILDCNDGCASDGDKGAPGICGCGIPDTDSDGDAVADCNDACPQDSLKTDPGLCGCGQTDIDTNENGTADCLGAEDLAAQIRAVLDSLRGVRPLSTSSSRKRRRNQRSKKRAVKDGTSGIITFATSFQENITLQNGAPSLTDLTSPLSRSVRRALRTGNPNFKRSKKRAIKLLNALLEALAL